MVLCFVFFLFLPHSYSDARTLLFLVTVGGVGRIICCHCAAFLWWYDTFIIILSVYIIFILTFDLFLLPFISFFLCFFLSIHLVSIYLLGLSSVVIFFGGVFDLTRTCDAHSFLLYSLITFFGVKVVGGRCFTVLRLAW